MKELMDAWTNFAAKDKEVLGLIVGEVRVSGTENRITWRTKGKDESSIVVISEPKASGNASIVVQLMGLKTLDSNNEAKATWLGIVQRFLGQK